MDKHEVLLYLIDDHRLSDHDFAKIIDSTEYRAKKILDGKTSPSLAEAKLFADRFKMRYGAFIWDEY